MIDAVGNNMETNMSFNDMKSLMDYGLTGSGLDIDTLNLKGDDKYINKIYYYKLDKQSLEETKSILQAHLGTDSTASDTGTNAVHADADSNGDSSTSSN
jgi:anionic cell wall polymer biosynthesis LytR-Cps2A-Psr (LCP) family protein